MNFIDFHAHIDFYQNYRKIYQQYIDKQIYTLFVTNLPEIFYKHYLQFEKNDYVRIALGFHPSLIQSFDLNKELFLKCLGYTDYIGEIGIDDARNSFFVDRQIEYFEFIIRNSGDKKLFSIHSRNSEDTILSILKTHNIKYAVFHWYTGNIKNLNDIINLGYYFSVNYKMLTTETGRKILTKIPRELILFESDAPHIKFNKSEFSPNHIPQIYSEFEKFYGISSFKELVFSNFKRLMYNKKNFIFE